MRISSILVIVCVLALSVSCVLADSETPTYAPNAAQLSNFRMGLSVDKNVACENMKPKDPDAYKCAEYNAVKKQCASGRGNNGQAMNNFYFTQCQALGFIPKESSEWNNKQWAAYNAMKAGGKQDAAMTKASGPNASKEDLEARDAAYADRVKADETLNEVCPISFIEQGNESSLLEIQLSPAAEKRCREQREKYLAARAKKEKAARANGATPQGAKNAGKLAELEQMIKDNRKSIGKNAQRLGPKKGSAYRGKAGVDQRAQTKDANQRHHALGNGRFQSETRSDKQGNLHDRRTGQFKKAKNRKAKN